MDGLNHPRRTPHESQPFYQTGRGEEKAHTSAPKLPRKINVPLKVESCSPRYMLIGTAFDYLLRFELQRQAPHAVTDSLVAEAATDMLWESHKGGGSFLNL